VLPRSTSMGYVPSAPETSKVPIAPMGDSRFARCLQGGGVFVQGGTVSIVNSQVYSNQATNVRARDFKSSPRPDGKIPDALASTHSCTTAAAALVNSRMYLPQSLKFSHPPMGDSRFARCLQGGGVFVNGGTVTLSSCIINGNTAGNVRAHLQKFPWPDVKVADVLAPTHACTTANASVNYRRYVPHRPSHRPHGVFTFQPCTVLRPIAPTWETHVCSLFTGRWCHGQRWHGDFVIMHHQWEHSSYFCARSSSKVPMARCESC